jgi:dolichyldiphosphatase
MEDPPQFASLSLTHVQYDPRDRLSYLSAWLALAPQGLCIMYVTLIWATREVEIMILFAGQMACEALNWGLKRWIKEERPRRKCSWSNHHNVMAALVSVLGVPNRESRVSTDFPAEMFGKGYGMPSSHSQFVAFFSLSLTLFLLFRHQTTNHTSYSPSTFAERLGLSLISIFCASSVAVSRVYLNYHTPKQVWIGFVAGLTFAVLWFLVTMYLRKAGWIEWGLDQWMARKLRMRDLILTEDLQDAGWGRFEERRLKRRELPDPKLLPNGGSAREMAKKIR